MAKSSPKAIAISVRSGRTLLTADIQLNALDQATPSPLDGDVQVAQLASLEARSEGFRLGETTVVIIDEAQVRWIHALCLAREASSGKGWPRYFLFHNYVLRLSAAGLANEALAFGARLALETRNLDRTVSFDLTDAAPQLADIRRFILGHELGHAAYRAGGEGIARLASAVQAGAADLTRLLRVKFAGDRSLLTAQEQDPAYEDIVASVTDYLNRFLFHEYAEAIAKYERDLWQRRDVDALMARKRRYDVVAEQFEAVDFKEEAFCDLYALEFRLKEAEDAPARAAEIVRSAFGHLHAMFALTAMDSLARSRLVAARVRQGLVDILAGRPVETLSDEEIETVYAQNAALKAEAETEALLVDYQVTMLKAIYRRVVFMNYVRDHPTLGAAELLAQLETDGEALEGQFIGACASLRFNGIRMDAEQRTAFLPASEPVGADEMQRLWADLTVRVPGLAELSGAAFAKIDVAQLAPQPRLCGFCGEDMSSRRLVLTSGRVSICDQCVLLADEAFSAMPVGQPRRPVVEPAVLSPVPRTPPRRADPSVPHCRFCEIAPERAEPLIGDAQGAIICAVCVEAAAKTVRDRSSVSDPAYVTRTLASIAGLLATAEASSSSVVRENLRSVAASSRASLDAALAAFPPGREVWCLFTEPTLAPDLPLAS